MRNPVFSRCFAKRRGRNKNRAVQSPLEETDQPYNKYDGKRYSKPPTFAASGALVGSSFLANVSSGT